MTKLLYIPNGEYVKFLSSLKYDMEHLEDKSEAVECFEDSYLYDKYGWSIEEYIVERCDGVIEITPLRAYELSGLNELEIIYD